MPSMEGLLVQTFSHKMVCHTTHKTPAFLPLEMVQSLSHPDTQPLYLIELRRFWVSSLRIRKEQLFILQGGNLPCMHEVSPVLITVSIGGTWTAPMWLQRLPHLQLLRKCVQGVETHIYLFPLRQLSHSKPKGIAQAG